MTADRAEVELVYALAPGIDASVAPPGVHYQPIGVPPPGMSPSGARRWLGTGRVSNALRWIWKEVRGLAADATPDPDRLRSSPVVGAWADREHIDWLLYTTATSVAFEAGRPYVAPVHDLQHRLQPHFPEVSNDGERERREYLFRNLTRHATLILVDSDVGREDVLEFYGPFGVEPDRVKVLPFRPPSYLAPEVSEAERARVRAALHLPERYLLYPAQFWPHKNHLRLVEAVGQLKQRGEEVHVVLCGSHTGPYRELTFAQMTAAADRLGVTAQVHLPGYVPDDAMSALYAESSGVLMPTFFGPTNIPVVEGWAFGKPVLSSDIRGVREQVGEAGLLVDPTSVEAIAEGVRRLWTDAELCAALVARGRQRLADQSPADFDGTFAAILREAGERVRQGDAPFARPRVHAA